MSKLRRQHIAEFKSKIAFRVQKEQKTLLTLFLVLITAPLIFAQTCNRDSSLLAGTSLISPQPTPPDGTAHTLWAAIIGCPYEQHITIKVPETFTNSGITIPVTSMSIATTGAIQNIAQGLTYKCDPPNCVFNVNTLGCVLIYGTPNDPSQAPSTLEPVIQVLIINSILPLFITIPGEFVPGTYYQDVRPAGSCTSSANDFSGIISALKNTPNPFTGQTIIGLESVKSGEFLFEVFNSVGRRIHHQRVQIIEGHNQFTFDGGDIPAGMYYYQVSSPEGKVSNTLVKM